MTTVGVLLKACEAQLTAGGIDTARLDAQLILAHALGQSRIALLLHTDHQVPQSAAALTETLLARRLRHEPMAYLLGTQEFWSLPFMVTPDVLIPRADSETLVEQALRLISPDFEGSLLDLGTGSGCLLLTILHERPGMTGLGVDISPAALEIAATNAERLGLQDRVQFQVGVWGQGVTGRFDLLVCNPPYVALAQRDGLMADVRDFEPAGALFAGDDGLDDYRLLLPQVAGLLNPGGHALFEIGHDQAAAVLALARSAGLAGSVVKDLGGRDRVVLLNAEGPRY
jgi:release factor glutamine methyltransferase